MTPTHEQTTEQKKAVIWAVLKKAAANGFDLKNFVYRHNLHIGQDHELAAAHMARAPLLLAVLCTDDVFASSFWTGIGSSTPPPPRALKDTHDWLATSDLVQQKQAMRSHIFYVHDPYEFLDRFLEDTDLPPYPVSE